MLTQLDIQRLDTAEKVMEVQIPAYRTEAERIGFYGIPALHETIEHLQASEELFWGYWEQGRLAGVIAVLQHDGVTEICRLVVHPVRSCLLLYWICMRLPQALQYPPAKRMSRPSGCTNGLDLSRPK
ncbi:GNAT family N-acetyltransferase [Paenibacillus protaetiae]|uniref:GNAT family N-acetyltransferase n=1 Tax=Paenibacillus protaetiae TaxID=2509456 RepID=A0A4P6EV04_9BACL|nr:GNAT family N-acetyltransferase [Paenibacillus protaetiae]QAY66804.1 GNAT family N-acetyltransferase [Paenibacillus protaetiae]